MSEESRLGRENIENGWWLKRIIESEVRVFYYLEDRERRLDSALDKIMMQLTSFAAEVEREKASQRVYDAAIRRVRAGHVAGAKIYGYDNVPVFGTTVGRDGQPQRLHTVRRINPQQAAVVRRIFALYADGYGTTTIMNRLNTEAVPSPRRRGWAQAAIKDMLRNELYAGVVIWGRVQNIVKKGTKKQRARPVTEHVRLEAPDLRIVSPELWDRVQARFAQQARRLPRRANGRLLGRPSWRDGQSSAYLLTGFAECAGCGGAIRTVTHNHNGAKGTPRRPVRFCGCATNQDRGAGGCANHLRLRQEILDRAILDAMIDLLDERLIATAIDRALEQLRAGEVGDLNRQTHIERELSLIEARMARLVETVMEGKATSTLLDTLQTEEHRKKPSRRSSTASSGAPPSSPPARRAWRPRSPPRRPTCGRSSGAKSRMRGRCCANCWGRVGASAARRSRRMAVAAIASRDGSSMTVS